VFTGAGCGTIGLTSVFDFGLINKIPTADGGYFSS
jgi:hypothetical protein